jgi:hypothetical protein
MWVICPRREIFIFCNPSKMFSELNLLIKSTFSSSFFWEIFGIPGRGL